MAKMRPSGPIAGSNQNNGRGPITTISSNNSRTSLIGSEGANTPIGIRAFGACFHFKSQDNKRTYHKVLVLILTFIAYAAFHMGRRPLSVVKNVLNGNCSAKSNSSHNPIISTNLNHDHVFVMDVMTPQQQYNPLAQNSISTNNNSNCNWAPFDDDKTANQLLATLDSAFLLSYAIFMFVSGILAERANLRYFISLGTILSGVGLIAFGLAHPLEIHSMGFFLLVQVLTGAFQTTGWPVVVTCVSNWFGPAKRGLIFGVWNSHTSLGNIFGAVLAGLFVEHDWGLSFIVPGGIMIAVGIILFMFLVPTPKDVHLTQALEDPIEEAETKLPHSMIAVAPVHNEMGKPIDDETSSEYSRNNGNDDKLAKPVAETEHKAVSFFTALKIPGVLEYSFCLFFSKLVSYTFLYWLPRFIKSSTSNNSKDSAYLSTPFDIGGIAGGILAGYISDKFKASGMTCIGMLLAAIPSMFLYQRYGPYSSLNNITLQLLAGILVNGPYSLITTAVSADLGNRIKDGHAMATVSGIIDGMGSIGAVLGPLFAGFASNSGDWQAVFIMLMVSDVLASICLIRVTVNEVKSKLSK